MRAFEGPDLPAGTWALLVAIAVFHLAVHLGTAAWAALNGQPWWTVPVFASGGTVYAWAAWQGWAELARARRRARHGG